MTDDEQCLKAHGDSWACVGNVFPFQKIPNNEHN